MPTPDIVAYQDNEGRNIVVAKTKAGIDWMMSAPMPNDGTPFMEFIESIPKTLKLAILCPNMTTINIVSQPLH